MGWLVNGQLDELSIGEMDGWMEERMDGWMDGSAENKEECLNNSSEVYKTKKESLTDRKLNYLEVYDWPIIASIETRMLSPRIIRL